MKTYMRMIRSAMAGGCVLAMLVAGAHRAAAQATETVAARGGNTNVVTPAPASVSRGDSGVSRGDSGGRIVSESGGRSSSSSFGTTYSHYEPSSSFGGPVYRADDAAYLREVREKPIRLPGRIVNPSPLSNAPVNNNTANNNNNNNNNPWQWPYYYGYPYGYGGYPYYGYQLPTYDPTQQQPAQQQQQPVQQPPAPVQPAAPTAQQLMADARQSMDDIRAQMWHQFEQSPQYIAAAADANRAEFAYSMALADARGRISNTPEYQDALKKKFAAEDELRALYMHSAMPPIADAETAATKKLQANQALTRLAEDMQMRDPKVAEAEKNLNTARDLLTALKASFEDTVKSDLAWQAAKRQYDNAKASALQ